MPTKKLTPRSETLLRDGPNPDLKPVALVVDDSRLQRRILASSLRKWGFEVLEAESGDAGLHLARNRTIDVILSDWMMPGMSGPEFCRAYRGLPQDSYAYFILLTSKTDKGAVTEGLDTGADDFLNKPVDVKELKSRINAGQRILEMQNALAERNRVMGETLAELQALHKAIDRDLEQACILQNSLMPPKHQIFDGFTVSSLFRPSGHVGGDLVGHTLMDDGQIAFWSIDVSGHGVASALITIRLSSLLKGSSGEDSLLVERGEGGQIRMRPPHDICGELNEILSNELETDHYLTMFVGAFDPKNGSLRFCQAGHPNAVIQRSGGRVEFIGSSGMPIGLIELAAYEEEAAKLEPGDRIFTYSDGLTECENPDGAMLEESGLSAILARHHSAAGTDFMEKLMWELAEFADGRIFGDDISAILIAYGKAGGAG